MNVQRGCLYFVQYCTYIIGDYNLNVGLRHSFAHHLCCVCYIFIFYLYFIHESWNLQLKVNSERIFFEILFMANRFIFRVFIKNLLRKSRRRNIFFTFRFVGDV